MTPQEKSRRIQLWKEVKKHPELQELGVCDTLWKMRVYEQRITQEELGKLRERLEQYRHDCKIQTLYFWDCDASGLRHRIRMINSFIKELEGK